MKKPRPFRVGDKMIARCFDHGQGRRFIEVFDSALWSTTVIEAFGNWMIRASAWVNEGHTP